VQDVNPRRLLTSGRQEAENARLSAERTRIGGKNARCPAYALYALLMLGLLWYVMGSMHAEEAAGGRPPDPAV
jgi:hypothetical protein